MVWAWLQALDDIVERPAFALFLDHMMFLEIVDMYSYLFYVFNQYVQISLHLSQINEICIWGT